MDIENRVDALLTDIKELNSPHYQAISTYVVEMLPPLIKLGEHFGFTAEETWAGFERGYNEGRSDAASFISSLEHARLK